MKQIDADLIPRYEEARLEAIRRFDILATPPDGAFDRITAPGVGTIFAFRLPVLDA